MMKKRLLKMMSCAFAGVLAVGAVATAVGCGKEEDDPTVVEVIHWDAGWGTEVFSEAVKRFNAKAEAEGYGFTVQYDYSSDQVGMRSEFGSGTTTKDLFICPMGSSADYMYFQPFDEMLDTKYGNETKTIREKLNPSDLAGKTRNGKVVLLPDTAQYTGMVYNKALFEQVGAEVPRTTDELLALCNDGRFNTTSHKAIIHFSDSNNGYYDYVFSAWLAQYNSSANYKNLANLTPYTAKYGGEEVTFANAKEVLGAKDGRYYALEVMQELLQNSHIHAASNSANFTTAQTAFLNGQAMMMVNGNWLGAEMKKNNGAFDGNKISMMKVPIISAIIDTLPDETIEDDEALCAVIDDVDAGKTWAERSTVNAGVSEADYNRIVDARGCVVAGGNASGLHVPNYSNSIDNTMKFVQYLYSDEVGLLWREYKQNDPCFTFDDESLNTDAAYDGWEAWFRDNCKNYKAIKNYISFGFNSNPIWSENGLDAILHVEYVNKFSASNRADRKTADQIWKDFQDKLDANWANWSSVTGL